ncbi:KEOPS complex subunit Pcc1 [Halorientalis halophila]|uniref:KEOPS complex subunit Pcc1 n=1 Tax=Halorientalis halophila TaxID=3108499 RepID=UPI0030093A46
MRAVIETTHGDPERAAQVAAALVPDNTEEMATTVDGRTVRTEIDRESTGGLHATVDDYVVNCAVADRLTKTQS